MKKRWKNISIIGLNMAIALGLISSISLPDHGYVFASEINEEDDVSDEQDNFLEIEDADTEAVERILQDNKMDCPDDNSVTEEDEMDDIQGMPFEQKGDQGQFIEKESDEITENALKLDVSGENSAVVDSGSCGDNANWVLYEDGTLEINGSGEMDDYDWKLPAPWDSAGKAGKVKSVVIADGITSVGKLAFLRCQSLSSVEIPESVTRIGREAFQECTSLDKINLSANVINIEGYAFMQSCKDGIYVDQNNQNYLSVDGILFDKKHGILMAFPNAREGSYIIPDFVTSIADGAFAWSQLNSVSMSDSVTSIGGDAFVCSYNLKDVHLSNNITAIDGWTFAHCAIETIYIPDGVTSIGNYAFYDCNNLKRVYIPGSVTNIEESSFVADTEEAITIITIQNSYAESFAKEYNFFVEISVKESFVQEEDGDWYYYKNNDIQKTADVVSGVINEVDDWWYIDSTGKVDFSFTGMVKSSQLGWVYVTKGKLDANYTGMAKNTYGWWYMKNGKLDQTYTGMAKNSYGWWYIKKGKLDQSYIGLANNEYGTWYMKKGKLDTSVSGMYKDSSQGWIYLNKGKWDTFYTDVAKNAYGQWYMLNGRLDTSLTGMYKAKSQGWIYVNKGKWDTNYTGMAKNDYGWWYMKNGKLDQTYTGMAKNAYGWWYMKNGKLNTTFTGIAQNQYGSWYMVKGKLANNYNGKVTFSSEAYSVKNGKATKL